MPRTILIALLVSSALASAAHAQPSAPTRSAPMALPVVETVPEPRDIPWTAGTIQLAVDATDTLRRIVNVTETIPVAGDGPLTLLLPEWLPGNHGPRGTIDKLAGLTVTAGGNPVAWHRDPLNVFAFHIAVPPGASSVTVKFQFLAPTDSGQGRITMTETMLDLQWNSVSLYPAGYYVRRVPIQATVTLPAGWTAATALRGTATNGTASSTVVYGETDYDTLIDSPLYAGAYARTIDLGHNVALDLLADDPAELVTTPEQVTLHKRMVDEAFALFGAHHFDHYDFLVAISDKLGGIGLEHHRSTEIGVAPGYFIKPEQLRGRYTLPHEFTHSWDGKFRRPDLLWTPDFRVPMQNDLLWVYEGQTQFWGYVLSARSGLYTKQQSLDNYAAIAARLDNAKGREWRPLEDTTYDPIIAARRSEPWASWQRSEDYYNEGLMIWLEADAIIRKGTEGAKGLDDFARAFFGVNDGDWGELLYNRQDIIDTLNSIYAYDWAGFFRDRVDSPTKEVTKGGFTLAGYKLVYGETANSVIQNGEKVAKNVDQSFGVGMVVADSGNVSSVVWNSAAFKGGITNGTKIIAVNGEEYSAEVFRKELKATTDKAHPLSLIIKQGTRYRTITLDYSGGIRYPRLEKTGEGDTSLDRLLAPKTGGAPAA